MRPEEVNHHSRSEIIEVDLMMGSNYKSVLLVMTNGATILTIIEKTNKSKNTDKMNKRLTNFSSCCVKTIPFAMVKSCFSS